MLVWQNKWKNSIRTKTVSSLEFIKHLLINASTIIEDETKNFECSYGKELKFR